MPVVLSNNAVSRLSATLSTGATAVSITPGEGAKFPSPSVGNWFPLTIVKASGALEIVRCTSRSGDVLTIARAQEGTAAQPFSVGDRAELRITAAAVADIQQTIADLAGAAMLQASNLSDLDDIPAARTNLGLGTAATSNVTTTASDRTSGSLLKVGDGGINTGPAYGADGPTTGIDAYKYCGFWSASATGTPVGNYPTIIAAGNETNSVQIASPVLEADRLFFRKLVSGAWKTARELFHTGNVSAFIQTIFPATDAANARSLLGVVDGPGVRMTWQDVSATRAPNTTYTNSTGVPILVSVRTFHVNAGGTQLTVGGVVVAQECASVGGGPNVNLGSTLTAIVPSGGTYSVERYSTYTIGTISGWQELRP